MVTQSCSELNSTDKAFRFTSKRQLVIILMLT